MSARDVLRVAPLCAAGFLAFGYNNVLMAVLPSYLTAAGMTLGEAGVQNGVFLILAVGLRFALGSVADRRGPRWAMLVGMASFAVGALMLALPLHFGTVLAARCVQAVGLALFWPAATAAVTLMAPPGRQGRYLGRYRFFTSLALLVGPAFGFWVGEQWGFRALFLVAVVAAVGAGFLVLACPSTGRGKAGGRSSSDASPVGRAPGNACGDGAAEEASGHRRPQRWGLVDAGGTSLALAIGLSAVAALGYGLVFSFSSTFLAAAGFPDDAGGYFTGIGLGSLALNLGSGWLLDRCGHHGVLAACLGAMALGMGLIVSAGNVPALLGVSGLLVGGGYGGAMTAAQTLTAARSAESVRTSVLAWQQNALDLGIAAASVAFGFVFAATSAANPVPCLLQAAARLVGALIACVCNRFSRSGKER